LPLTSPVYSGISVSREIKNERTLLSPAKVRAPLG
jgi:hypothetical protein